MFMVIDVDYCDYIFCLILDQIWISDKNNFLFINKIGVILYCFVDLCRGYGVYIVNYEGELIYIDMNYDIKKLLKNVEIIILLKIFLDIKWKLCCVYLFLYIGNLLVVM